ncbi:MAG: molecular chaperone HtpG [Eubacterium sp.]
MKKEQGSLAINSDNIFPIIKKWLYSDHDIFIRELVSNGCDAITKLKKLEMIGETTLSDDYKEKVEVFVNAEDKTIRFVDNGLGMTEGEVKEYINQIAFSGATDFLEKYKDKSSEDQIIGHFGLGFYSAFMVADRVEINTCSYIEGEQAIHWESECGTEFEMSDSDKDTVGTEIILHLNEDSYEFSNEYRVREVLEKYCSFMPVEIFLTNENAEPQYETILSEEVTEKDTVIEEIVEEPKEEKEGEEKKEPVKKTKILKRPVSISDTKPLWTKHPNECTEEEYKEFYRKVFQDYKEPLFWIHLNMDYPFNLKGILYFPKVNLEYENAEGIIKLYNNQVFIADNIKEVIPEFLMLLKGVIDCPDLPLNVSRSALQNDGFVAKIADYITKKVADKLTGMCKTDRENFEKYWDDISPFIKYGCLKDEKFKGKMKDYILFKDLDDNYKTMKEYLETVDTSEVEVVEKGEEEKDSEPQEPPKTVIYYVTDKKQQSQYINMFREENKNAFVLTHSIDQPFISSLEMGDDNVKFQRIDAQVTEDFVEEMSEEEIKEKKDALTEIFKKALGKENLDVRVEKMKNEKIASMITMSEETRRMQDMMKMYAMNGMGAMGDFGGETLVLNVANPLVQYVENHKDGDKTDLFCKQLYDLAKITHKPLEPEEMTEFVMRSNEIMELLAKE